MCIALSKEPGGTAYAKIVTAIMSFCYNYHYYIHITCLNISLDMLYAKSPDIVLFF